MQVWRLAVTLTPWKWALFYFMLIGVHKLYLIYFIADIAVKIWPAAAWSDACIHSEYQSFTFTLVLSASTQAQKLTMDLHHIH